MARVGVNSEFWRDRRVLVTGHTGFKGSWLSLWLQGLGADVTGFAHPPHTEPSLFELANVASGMRSRFGDVRDSRTVETMIREARPEVIVHMAAQSLVRHSYAHPVETYETNVMGTVNVLEAVREVGDVRVVVVVTSDKCYENLETNHAYREEDRLGGHDPYSSSKACAELVTAAYRRSFFAADAGSDGGVAVASARAGNVIGGGDWARDRLVVDIFEALLEGVPVRIRHPEAVRPWQHVLDPLAGYLQLAEAMWRAGDVFADAWNFGPDPADVKPVAWIADRLVDVWGGDATWEREPGNHVHEATLLMLDSSKARERLGWRPRMDLMESLGWIAEWYRGYQRGRDLGALTREQIERYRTRLHA